MGKSEIPKTRVHEDAPDVFGDHEPGPLEKQY